MTAGGHRYGLLAHYLSNGTAAQGMASSAVSITDETTGWYTRSEVALPPRVGLTDGPGVNIHTQNITWTGNATRMQLQAGVPEGRIDVVLRPRGQVLYNLATGYFPMFADPKYPNYEYAFPTIDTTGTLTLNGVTHQVHGESWMDRQWGAMPADLMTGKFGWTWMNLDVRVTTKNQELLTPIPRYEGSATITGPYQGHHVTGYNYVEQAGAL